MKNTLVRLIKRHWAALSSVGISVTAWVIAMPADKILSGPGSHTPASGLPSATASLSIGTLALLSAFAWGSLIFFTLGIVFIFRFLTDPRRAIKARISSKTFPRTLDTDSALDLIAIVTVAATLLFVGRIAYALSTAHDHAAQMYVSLLATTAFQIFAVCALYTALRSKISLFRFSSHSLSTWLPLFKMYLSIIPISLAASLASVGCAAVFHITQTPMPLVEAVISKSLSPQSLIIVTADAVLLAPLAEELIFRGALFSWLRGRLPFWAAGLLSAAVFALLHDHSLSILPITVIGFFFAYAYEKTKDLGACVFLHALYNLLSMLSLIMFRSMIAG